MLHKRFGSTYALRGVDLSLLPGHCLGLVGRNGAGKSTLVSILSGILTADAGQVLFDGQPAPSDTAGWRGRIATVFQHSMVVPSLTVAENVFLGTQPDKAGFVDWREMRARDQERDGRVGLRRGRQPRRAAALTVEQRQIVEIVRALAAGTRCLLLDEPTAALERGAVQRLFERIRQLRQSGVAILYISHHLEEVFEICTEAAVLRDGELVLSAPIVRVSKDDLVTAMVGQIRHSERTHPARRPSPASPSVETAAAASAPGAALTVSDIALDSPGTSLHGVSLTVRPGERVGITGLRGSGATTLARIVAGAVAPDAGTVRLGGRALRPGDRAAAWRAGIGTFPRTGRPTGSCRCSAWPRTSR